MVVPSVDDNIMVAELCPQLVSNYLNGQEIFEKKKYIYILTNF